MQNLLRGYQSIPRPVLLFIAAEQLLTLVNVVLMLIFNLVLRDLGHSDVFIARIASYRYLGTLALALPFGLLLRGRRVKPLLVGASMLIPGATLVMLHAARTGNTALLSLSVLGWGIGLMLMQVSSLPLIVRLTPPEHLTEAISLSYATFSLAMVGCGALVPALRHIGRISIPGFAYPLDDAGIIGLLAAVGLLAVPLMLCIAEGRPVDATATGGAPLSRGLGGYDWHLIARVIAPNLAIAIGAGLTMPFVNLFFNSVFELSAPQFSMLAGVAGVFVLIGSLLNPAIRRRFGYRVAVLLSQSLAVAFLIGLAMTEILSRHLPGMLGVAVVCYVIRQPLMNMAQPITSELALSYVGARNRELIAALHTSIWSGAWFLSARIFRVLRAANLPYWQIFLITASLYVVGIVLFWRLIRAHERQAETAAGTGR